MKKFPQFLKTMPAFWGLSLFDLPLIMLGLIFGMIFKLNGLTALLISFVMIICRKFILKRFDLVGFFAPRWQEVRLKVSSQKRGQNDSNI
jgi:hypothetical protein